MATSPGKAWFVSSSSDTNLESSNKTSPETKSELVCFGLEVELRSLSLKTAVSWYFFPSLKPKAKTLDSWSFFQPRFFFFLWSSYAIVCLFVFPFVRSCRKKANQRSRSSWSLDICCWDRVRFESVNKARESESKLWNKFSLFFFTFAKSWFSVPWTSPAKKKIRPKVPIWGRPKAFFGNLFAGRRWKWKRFDL